ncbi:hypothetical protein MTO96_018832 [Rhipicephalus appendiculatus]
MADKPGTKSRPRSQRSPSPAKTADRDPKLKRGAGSSPRKATSTSPSKSRGSTPKKSRSSSPSPARALTGSPSRRRRKTSPPPSPRSRSPMSRSPRMSSRSPRATVSGSRRPSATGKMARRFRSRINAAIQRDHERRSRIYQWFKGLAGRKGSPRGGSSPRLRQSGRSRASPGFGSPAKSGSSPSRSTRERTSSRTKYGSTLLVLVVIALVVAAITLVSARYLRKPAASTQQQCVSETCHRYEELLSNAMDPEAQPCDNFYAHVCGTWIKTAKKPVYEIAKRTADLNPHVGANQRPVDKAVAYIKACLSPLERDNMHEVRAALAAAGIVWPQQVTQSDFLYSMFYMSRRIFQPVFLTIDFLSTYYKISEHVATNHVKEHFRITYESLASANETRLDHLFNDFIAMMRFMDNHLPVTDAGMSTGDPAAFLVWTPSVPESRWDAQTRGFLNSTLRNLTGCFVDRVGGFRAMFELHQAFGEEKMANFVGFFAVQTLVGFTNIRLLESFYKASDVAIEEQRKACIMTAYQTFAYAIDSFLQKGTEGAQQDVNTLVNWTTAAFGRLLKSTDNSSVLVGHSKPDPEPSNLNHAFSILNSSSRMAVDSIYAAFPEMFLDAPLSDSINVSAFMQAREQLVSMSGQPSQTLYASYQALDATVFSGFRVNPQLLAFPWYEPDAHIGVLLGGLGARLAAATFYDYVERTGTNSTLYTENQACLSAANNASGGVDVGDVDPDLQGAVAAAAVVADVYKEVARTDGPKWTGRETPPPWTSESMTFVFFCWLNCGDSERGPMMCNAPVMHNRDFGRVFACPEGSRMNPVKKCQMRL